TSTSAAPGNAMLSVLMPPWRSSRRMFTLGWRPSAAGSQFMVVAVQPRGMVLPDILRRYSLTATARATFMKDLRMLGVQEASAFPDPDGLARELTQLYGVPGADEAV